MLTVNLICIGKLKEAYWRDASQEYSKRLSAFCRFSILELSESRLPEHPSQAQIDAALQEEGEKLIAAIGNASAVFPLCIEGKQISSPQLAERIEKLTVNGISTVNFIIGSSFGLAEKVKCFGEFKLSMSLMTFPHQLARVMLCEQIYRAFQIINHGKYHK